MLNAERWTLPNHMTTNLNNIIIALSASASALSAGATGAETARAAIVSAINSGLIAQNQIAAGTPLSQLGQAVTDLIASIEVEDGVSQSDIDAAVAALDAEIVAALTPIKNTLQGAANGLTTTVGSGA